MTRLFLLPLLLLCPPLLAKAQTNATKESSLNAPAEGALSAPASAMPTPAASANNSAANTARPMSQGIIPPKLIHTIAMKDDGKQHVHLEGRQRVVTVYLTVNAAGEPTDLHIPEPVDDALDVEVLATIGKFRYLPGMLDGKPIAMPVHMHYVVPVGAIY